MAAVITGVMTGTGELKADAYIVALGSYSPLLLQAAWASGYRSTRSRATRSPCRSPIPPARPESTVMDETYKVAITRLGDRIRVGGMAELAGYNTDLARSPRAGR